MKSENLHVHHIVKTQVPRLVQDRVKLWMQVTMMANRNLLWTAAFIRIITTFYEVTLTCPVHVGAAEKLWRRSSPFFSSSENENRPRPAGFFSSAKTASFLQRFRINGLDFHNRTSAFLGLLVIGWSSTGKIMPFVYLWLAGALQDSLKGEVVPRLRHRLAQGAHL